jgi:hypothetical protein
VGLYYRVATATEPASYTWTASTSLGGFTGIIAVYSGVNPSNPIDVNAGASAASTTPNAPSVTTTAANDELVVIWSTWASNVSLGPPSGLTARLSYSGHDPLLVADERLGATAATGRQSATTSAAPLFWTGQTVALRPGTTSPGP